MEEFQRFSSAGCQLFRAGMYSVAAEMFAAAVETCGSSSAGRPSPNALSQGSLSHADRHIEPSRKSVAEFHLQNIGRYSEKEDFLLPRRVFPAPVTRPDELGGVNPQEDLKSARNIGSHSPPSVVSFPTKLVADTRLPSIASMALPPPPLLPRTVVHKNGTTVSKFSLQPSLQPIVHIRHPPRLYLNLEPMDFAMDSSWDEHVLRAISLFNLTAAIASSDRLSPHLGRLYEFAATSLKHHFHVHRGAGNNLDPGEDDSFLFFLRASILNNWAVWCQETESHQYQEETKRSAHTLQDILRQLFELVDHEANRMTIDEQNGPYCYDGAWTGIRRNAELFLSPEYSGGTVLLD